MTFLKRMFSSDYRRALGAEAAGDYQAAARAYALAGERPKVAEMHLLLAERATTMETRLEELRAGVRWADESTPEGRAVRRRIARSLLMQVRAAGVISDNDRALLREAAALFAGATDHAGAAESYELAGDDAQAADHWLKAGEVDRMEAVLGREEERRRRRDEHRTAFAEYQLHMAAGARDAAREALERALALTRAPEAEARGARPQAAAQAEAARRGLLAEEYRAMLEALDARRLADGRVTVRASTAREPSTYIGAFPLVLGREPGCQLVLRDPGISRRHAEILEAGGRFRVRDAGSRNGTRLGGMPIAGELPLDGEGALGLGDHCSIRFRTDGMLLHLEVVAGLDRGLRVVAGPGPLPIAGGLAELRFPSGRPTLAAPGQRLLLDGVAPGPQVELLRGDRLELGEGATRVELEIL